MTTKHGSLSEQEIKRLQGGELILNGYDNNDIAEIVGVSLCAVRKWRKKLANNNDDMTCLVRKQGAGRPSKLNETQKTPLKDIDAVPVEVEVDCADIGMPAVIFL